MTEQTLATIPLTRDRAQLFKEIEFNGRRAYYVFRTVPDLEIRKQCLDVMRHHTPWLNAGNVGIEGDIRTLAAAGDPLWEEFLFLYVYFIKGSPAGATRAAKLVLEVCPKGKESARSKLMRSILPYNEKQNFPYIREFLRSEVDAFLATVTSVSPFYEERDWYRLTRALGVLIEQGDAVTLGQVRHIAEALRDHRIRLVFSVNERAERFLLVQHRAYIAEALRQLKHIGDTI